MTKGGRRGDRTQARREDASRYVCVVPDSGNGKRCGRRGACVVQTKVSKHGSVRAQKGRIVDDERRKGTQRIHTGTTNYYFDHRTVWAADGDQDYWYKRYGLRPHGLDRTITRTHGYWYGREGIGGGR